MIQHIKLRWLSLYASIDRLLLVYNPVKDYFTDQSNKQIPIELKKTFESSETLCVLAFLHHVLFEIRKANLELQKSSVTAIDLHRIISTLQYKLKQRVDNLFFGAYCRQLLNQMPSDSAARLQSSFVDFVLKFLDYVEKYFGDNAVLLETIGRFARGIEDLTWQQVVECVKVINISGVNTDKLFDEFHELKLTYDLIKKKKVPLSEQIQSYVLSKTLEGEKFSSNTSINIDEDQCDEESNEQTTARHIRSDQFWAMLLNVNATPTPNMKKLICFIYSIPASNAYVEGVFSELKHLLNDHRNRMTVESIAAELKIRRNGSLSCDELLSRKGLLKAIVSNEKFTFKKRVE